MFYSANVKIVFITFKYLIWALFYSFTCTNLNCSYYVYMADLDLHVVGPAQIIFIILKSTIWACLYLGKPNSYHKIRRNLLFI